MLSVLLLAQGQVLVTLLLSLSEGLAQALHLFLEVLDRERQLQLSLRQALRQVADDSFTLLNLPHVRLRQSLDFILVGLIELIDLILCLLFANHGLPSVVLERLKNALMVKLHLLLLLLLLLELKPHELIFLLGHGCVLDSLALERFVLLFELLDDLFKLLDALAIGLLFLLLRFIFLSELRIESSLECLVIITELVLSITELLQLALHHLLTLVPFLPLNCSILFFILELIFKFEDLFRKLFDLG